MRKNKASSDHEDLLEQALNRCDNLNTLAGLLEAGGAAAAPEALDYSLIAPTGRMMIGEVSELQRIIKQLQGHHKSRPATVEKERGRAFRSGAV